MVPQIHACIGKNSPIECLVNLYGFKVFIVENYHTYFVGECNVWVHNAQCGQQFTPEQQKLIKEAKKARPKGMTRKEANDFVKRSRKAGLNAEIHEGHMQRTNPSLPMNGVSGKPHLHPHNHSLHIPIHD